MPTAGERIVSYAKAQLGDPYGWGAEGPDAFDCSGLVFAAYKAAGLDVQRTTAANLGRQGAPVSLAHAQPGDVVYFDNPGTTDHVGIYAGNGQMIEAPTFGVPVRVSAVRNPTSIRRMPEVMVAGISGTGPGDLWEGVQDGAGAVGGAIGDAAGAIGDAAGGVLGVFEGWKGGLLEVAIKLTAAAAAAALVIVGAKSALQNG